ncbi:uncharacterized protein LAESUDRAFT_810502 [Laetiporus sulphureus 93-53]|uniref:Mitotic checkpoint regulator, MAD2B-interacting-domain-containing protein n=1 Tax=Laetiporus sulphureus 93-53 TaxID=1314785 RepID=A0A165FW81_9APHY|nr:uncharacterized protein LAESUDRAFT_810502 [Laetiporus sulphureus 93-53]KZT09492.1 hypothetical protein LAESUDRAFT_810502 [Laetiporus sulphureus 93-53]
MLGIEDYGSDNDSESEIQLRQPVSIQSTSGAAELPPPARKSTFSLPSPINASSGASSKSPNELSLRVPKVKKSKKIITIGLPELPPEEDTDRADGPPVAKKPRITPGARSSALLSMLPAPKNKSPINSAPERVLGAGRGPGLVFNTGSRRSVRTVSIQDVPDKDNDEGASGSVEVASSDKANKNMVIHFLPPSLVKGKANISVEEKDDRPRASPTASSSSSIGFFSIASTTESTVSDTRTSAKTNIRASTSAPSVPNTSPALALPLLPGVSSAPKVDDFAPPEPSPQDPYPGYYMLPSGVWAAYDPEYYRTYYDRWKREYDEHVRALEKGVVKGFEAIETEGAEEINASRVMEKAKKEIQEREERKALTTGDAEVPAAPKMNIKGAALGGRARTRHQLSTLLTEAYQNRETLEEKIAQGRRNRKEAGNKYGF